MADTSVLDGSTDQGNLPLSPAGNSPALTPMPAPVPARQRPWATILQGALSGLAGSAGANSFGGGLAGGAAGYIAEQQRQIENQQRQVDIKFKSAQAAALAAQAHMDEQRLAALPQQIQDEHTNQVLSQLEHIKQIFPGVQITVTPNDSKSLTQAMTSETKTNGGVGPAIHLNAGDKIYSIDLSSLSASPAGLTLVNDGLRKMGKQLLDPSVWSQMDAQVRNNYLVNAANFGTETPSDSKVAEYQGYLDTVKAKADYPQKQSDINELQTAIDRFKKGADAAAQLQNQRKADTAAAEAEATKPIRDEEHQFQQKLTQETAALNRSAADTTARSLKADEMITKEANDRDADLKNITDLKNNLSQIDAKNQAATNTFQVKFAEHEIVEGGVKRLNQTELDALTKSLGTYGRQFQAWVDKGFKGDMPKASKDEMLAILNAEESARNNLYNSRVGNIQRNILHTSVAPAAAAPATNAGETVIDLRTKK